MIRNSFYLFQQGGNIEFVAKDFQQLDRGGTEAQVDLSPLSSGNLLGISQHPGEGSHYHMPAKFHSARRGPPLGRAFSLLKAPTSAFLMKTLYEEM